MTWQDNYIPLRNKLAGQADQFVAKAVDVQREQHDKLFQILQYNRSTEFGTRNEFSSITSVGEFQDKISISNYKYYEQDFLSGHCERFLAEQTQQFAWTSGTSSAHKKIPIGPGLVNDFEAGLLPWFDNLLINYPRLTSGPAYWIVGPQVEVVLPKHSSEVDDSVYFSPTLARTLSSILSSPPTTRGQGEFREWAFATLLHLALEPELSWISIWSPTLFIELLESFEELQPFLLEAFEHGDCARIKLNLARGTIARLNSRLADKRLIIPSAIKILRHNFKTPWQYLWPNLTFCSCWKDGWAGLFLARLSSLLPDVTIQGKGLLATEAMVSIPFEDPTSNEPVLAYRSHFFEFRTLNTEEIYLAQELKEGEKYEVLVTTSGGLYRYQLEDVVQVIGFIGQAPRLRLIGKKDMVSDLCGEKLHESHVAQCLTLLSQSYNFDLRHAQLRPVISNTKRFYQLVLPEAHYSTLINLGSALDQALHSNPHYAACRKLRQLSPIQLLFQPLGLQNNLASTSKHFCLQTQPVILENAKVA